MRRGLFLLALGLILFPKVGWAQHAGRVRIRSHAGTPGGTPPSFTLQPVNVTVTAGQTASFTATVTGDATITCQWYRPASVTPIGGATSCTGYSFSTVIGDNGATFNAIATNSSGSATSNTATLTVNAPAQGNAASNGNGGSRLHRLH